MPEPVATLGGYLMEELFDRLLHNQAREEKFAAPAEPFFKKPLLKPIIAIVIEFCFRPLGVVKNAHTTWSQGWDQKCKCCMEKIGPYDYFCEVYEPKTHKSQHEIAYASHRKKYRGALCVWQHGHRSTSSTCMLHGDTIYYDPVVDGAGPYVCDPCMNWTRDISYPFWGPVDIKGDDFYGTQITSRLQRRRLNPRRRIKYYDAMTCPVTKLLRALKA